MWNQPNLVIMPENIQESQPPPYRQKSVSNSLKKHDVLDRCADGSPQIEMFHISSAKTFIPKFSTNLATAARYWSTCTPVPDPAPVPFCGLFEGRF
jgi:hypothetical protein